MPENPPRVVPGAASVEQDLLYAVEDGIARITINRPRARNAFTFAMYERLAELCGRIDGDRGVKAAIIAGAGKSFAAGTDIAQFRGFETAQDAIDYEARIERVLRALEACRVPTIAAIGGACTGGGCAIAACCDLRVAAPDARFGFPMARTLGNCLSLANIARLVALIGQARVIDLLFTARLVEAEEAMAIGLVTRLAPSDAELPDTAARLARLVAGHAPLTLRQTKAALRRLSDAVPTGDADEIVLGCYLSRDFREGIEAFLAKRPAAWTGE